jgi:rod shape-determining protein MreD
VRGLRFALALAAALFLQVALGRFSGAFARYSDLTLLPVAWYAIRGTQRSAMLAGCVTGLVHDAWFRLGVFGMGGFKRTLLGWMLGGLGNRFNLNHRPGRFAVGALLAIGDGLLDMGLRRLIDFNQDSSLFEITVRAGCTGLLAVVVFGAIDRFRDPSRRGRLE